MTTYVEDGWLITTGTSTDPVIVSPLTVDLYVYVAAAGKAKSKLPDVLDPESNQGLPEAPRPLASVTECALPPANVQFTRPAC